MTARSRAIRSATLAANDAPALAVSHRFSGYQPETEKAVRTVKVTEDKALEQLKGIWRMIRIHGNEIDGDVVSMIYRRMANRLKGCSYTAADVERFSLALGEFREEKAFSDKAGIFLSALMNNGNAGNYTIWTSHLDRINWLCFRNTRNVTINGNTGDVFANGMKGGRVVVRGDAFDIGSLKGGEIVVRGNVDAISGPLNGGNILIWGRLRIIEFMNGLESNDDWKNCTITIKGRDM
jgi:hypothetical protein